MVLQVTDETRQIWTTLTDKQKEVTDNVVKKFVEYAKEESMSFAKTGKCIHPMFLLADWVENSGEITGTEQEIARIFVCGINAGMQLDEKFKESLRIANAFRNLQDFIDKEKFSNELGD